MMSIKEPTKIEEDLTDMEIRHQNELAGSMINTLFKVTAQQEVEIVRLTQDCKALQGQLEKLAESNGSLVKHNIALRRQVTDLKTPTLFRCLSAPLSLEYQWVLAQRLPRHQRTQPKQIGEKSDPSKERCAISTAFSTSSTYRKHTKISQVQRESWKAPWPWKVGKPAPLKVSSLTW